MKILKFLKHPNIVELKEIVSSNGTCVWEVIFMDTDLFD
jgi:hypothetical protein